MKVCLNVLHGFATDQDAPLASHRAEQRHIGRRRAVAHGHRTPQHELRHVVERHEFLAADRMPTDVFKLVARCGVSEYGGAVGEEKTGVEASEDRGRGDGPSDISQYVDRRADTALRIGRLDRAEAVQVLRRGGRRPGAPADYHADLLPGLAQRGAGAAGEARRKMSAPGLDPPGLSVFQIDCAAGKYPDTRHEFRTSGTAPRE